MTAERGYLYEDGKTVDVICQRETEEGCSRHHQQGTDGTHSTTDRETLSGRPAGEEAEWMIHRKVGCKKWRRLASDF